MTERLIVGSLEDKQEFIAVPFRSSRLFVAFRSAKGCVL
jgi:hypothetical protein